MTNRTGLIVALDHPDLATNLEIADRLKDQVDAFKIGFTLFAKHGPEAITEVRRRAKVFLDLKLHDIPEQIARCARVVAEHGVWMFTAHASGGREMLQAAVDGAGRSADAPIVAGVTVLTSFSEQDLEDVGQDREMSSQVFRLAQLAIDCGARALVSSGREVAALRSEFENQALLIVPGVRLEESRDKKVGGHSRVVTPRAAGELGADYIVVGRPITESTNSSQTAATVIEQLTAASP
jgi:orotidine-5'-phosphate decarboxylase